MKEIERLAHDLKGSGGNIGAKALYDAAQTLESVIKENAPSTSTDDLIAHVESRLNEVLHSIEFLVDGDKKVAPEKIPVRVDNEKAIRTLGQLSHSLDIADPVAIQEKLDTLGLYLDAAKIGKLRREINSYDYDLARNSLEEIIEELTGEVEYA